MKQNVKYIFFRFQ